MLMVGIIAAPIVGFVYLIQHGIGWFPPHARPYIVGDVIFLVVVAVILAIRLVLRSRVPADLRAQQKAAAVTRLAERRVTQPAASSRSLTGFLVMLLLPR
jgi:uncharacterized membrane protein